MSLQALEPMAAPVAAPPNSPLPPSPATSLIGWKLPPVCQEEKMKEASMTAEELSEMAFDSSLTIDMPASGTDRVVPTLSSITMVRNQQTHQHSIPVSSSSSTCTRESDTSDAEGNPVISRQVRPVTDSTTTAMNGTPPPSNATAADPTRQLDRERSDQINAKVSQVKTSRQGRGSQRWLPASNGSLTTVGSDQDDGSAAEQQLQQQHQIRLVTGCVPILKGGKILLVSASRKPEWILPKGGWESDEAMEESAIREVFEEAGVLGVLGPRLSEVQYETRKSKKRRLEQAEMLEKKLKKAGEDSSTETDERMHLSCETLPDAIPDVSGAHGSAPISNEDMTRIRGLSQEIAQKNTDETASCTSGHSSTYSLVRMTLLPLYVNKVLASWPEQGRLRMAVDIDTAIEMQASRPEFKAALMEVKERGLHLIAS